MNKLIIVEGLPCSGKSTAAKFIAEQTGYHFVDEGTRVHPADYEFHAFLTDDELEEFTSDECEAIILNSERKSGGLIVSLEAFSGELFNKLIQHKIYDFLPWETERPVMLDKWRGFVQSCGEERYVFNCVFLQNPMCETMIRFGFDKEISAEYISEINEIIKPLSPVIIYLRNSDIRSSIEASRVERGQEWLNEVIDYHCCGKYGIKHRLIGFDGYISALEERQRRELEILDELDAESIVLDNPQNDWDGAYAEITEALYDNFSCN